MQNKKQKGLVMYTAIKATAIICLIAAGAFSDGPPIRNGNLSVPYITLKLSDEQIIQAGIYRYIQLDASQKTELKKIAKMEVPNLLMIITAPYNDCTCGDHCYGFWAQRAEVQISKGSLENLKETAFDCNTTVSISELKKKMSLTLINIDIEGNVYHRGILANNFSFIDSVIEANRKAPKTDMYLWVNTPPLTSTEVIIKTKTAFINIKKFFSDYGVYAFFENEYINSEILGYDTLSAFSAEFAKVDMSTVANGCSVFCGTNWKTSASSIAKWKDTEYSVSYLTDSLLTSAWIEGVPGHGIGQSIILNGFTGNQDKPVKVNGLIIANGFQKSKDIFYKNSRVKAMVLLFNGDPKFVLDFHDVMGCQKVLFPEFIVTPKDEIVVRIVDIYGGIKYQDTGLSLLIPCYEKMK